MTKYDLNIPAASLKEVYIEELDKLMSQDARVVHMDADMESSLGSHKLKEKYPGRIIDTGIMEANMIGIACGMSVGGKIPFAHSFNVFSTRRCADQIYMSGCYNKANVKILGSDPGIHAEHNGGTHMSFDDVALMRAFPEMQVLDIADAHLLRKILPKVTEHYGMCYIRMTRRAVEQYYAPDDTTDFEIGKGVVLREGGDVSIIAAGIEVVEALKAAEKLHEMGIEAEVIDMFTIKPVDREIVVKTAKKTGAVVTAENSNYLGGLGSAVAEIMAEEGIGVLRRIGVPDRLGEVGTIEYLAEIYKLRSEDIVESCLDAIKTRKR